MRERTLKLDNVSPKTTGNTIRDNCTSMLYTSLALGSELDSLIILEKAVEIEKKTFSQNGNEVAQKYKSRIRTLYMNLKDKKNPELRGNILSGELSVQDFCEMSVEVSRILVPRIWHLSRKRRKLNGQRRRA